MKPFRGKPEKPERSNGKIQPRLCRLGAIAARRYATASPRPRSAVQSQNACTSSRVGRRDPLGAGLRAAGQSVRTVLRSVRARGLPAGSLDGRQCGAEPRPVRARPAASSDAIAYAGPGADAATARLWPRSPRADSVHARRRRYSFGYFQDPS